jgi:DNA-binding XRE family transcriptional regulator
MKHGRQYRLPNQYLPVDAMRDMVSFRKRYKVTQKDFARKLRITRQMYQRIESGKASLTPEVYINFERIRRNWF